MADQSKAADQARPGLPGATGCVERRRPGRIENVSPELIPLLRGQTRVEPQPEPPVVDARGRWTPSSCLRAERLAWLLVGVFLMVWAVVRLWWR